MNRIMKRMALPIGVATVLGSTGFAFMAANVQGASSLGYSSNSVNGYDVEGIHYVACAPMDGEYCNVEFRLKPRNGDSPANTGTNVQASVNNDAFKTCIYMGAPGSNQGTLWRCSFDEPAVSVSNLKISAAQ